MSDYKPITGELRGAVKRAETIDGKPMVTCAADEFKRLCDAIDAVDRRLAEELGRSVRLPLDADGVPFRGGDDVFSDTGMLLGSVTGIGVGEREGWIWLLRSGKNVSRCYQPHGFTHHHPDTWEHIIEDALGSRWSAPNELSQDFTALVARCKKLAGDAE